MEKVLDIKNLRISFRTNNGTVKAVRGINFSVEKGETVAVVGESGSGKSVTARAIMGILAPNAIYDGGEIIYDGRDLMKIPEEEFHKIRGHRISMIFQDPLSSLNPIVKIGKQLTEAMILNGKASRKLAGKEYKSKIAELKKCMIGAGVNNVEQRIAKLNQFTKAGNVLELEYNTSEEAFVLLESAVQDLIIELNTGDTKEVEKQYDELLKLIERAYHPFLISKAQFVKSGMLDKVKEGYKKLMGGGDNADIANALKAVSEYLKTIENNEKPNFFTLGYYNAFSKTKKSLEELSADIKGMNAANRKLLDDEFMSDFLKDVAKGLKYADEAAQSYKTEVVEKSKTYLDLVRAENLDFAKIKNLTKDLKAAVAKSINHMDLVKDSVAYTFENSIDIALSEYEAGKKLSGKKVLSKKKKEKKSNIDMNILRENIEAIVLRLHDTTEAQVNNVTKRDYSSAAVAVIDFLKEQGSRQVTRISRRMAKHRAIELMKEVGIPQAKKRYNQYPFEFSGGMRQRIVIAIALSSNPDILICDEPTTALDVTIQAQILDLINGLKEKRKLSVIFITHDLGVVANMADKICVMYAGKIVERGSVDEVFYDPKHPYTWALLSSMPDLFTEEKLEAIPGTPPNMITPPKGDAFAARNKYALKIDFEEEPPLFKITDTHYAATWLVHPKAPKVEPPKIVTERIARMKKLGGEQ